MDLSSPSPGRGLLPLLNVSGTASRGVQRVCDAKLQPPALLLYLGDQPAGQDHQSRLHCFQFAQKPRVARDEHILDKSAVTLLEL